MHIIKKYHNSYMKTIFNEEYNIHEDSSCHECLIQFFFNGEYAESLYNLTIFPIIDIIDGFHKGYAEFKQFEHIPYTIIEQNSLFMIVKLCLQKGIVTTNGIYTLGVDPSQFENNTLNIFNYNFKK